MKDYFKLKERNTNVKTEIRAGVTTFLLIDFFAVMTIVLPVV